MEFTLSNANVLARDNAQYVIKGLASAIARVFSEAISCPLNGELVAALLRYGFVNLGELVGNFCRDIKNTKKRNYKN